MSDLCVRCKGRLFCGLNYCPLLSKISAGKNISQKIKGNNVFGDSPPNFFVGHYGYPSVFGGPMINFSGVEVEDDPSKWYGSSIEDIVRMRSSQLMARTKLNINSSKLEEARLSTLSLKPVEMEAIVDKINYSMSFSNILQPIGPTADLKKINVTENFSIPSKVDKLLNEKISVRESISELTPFFDVYYLQKLLSGGFLGVKNKLVPTRWSITAIDKIVGDEFLKKVKDLKIAENYFIFSNTYLFNHFEILLIPGSWEFEQFEVWHPESFWNNSGSLAIEQEYEGFEGRSDYAEKEGGGYYAGRLGVIEGLKSLKIQAKAVVFREISKDYKIPVGVGEVRENVRHAFLKKPLKLSSLKDVFQELKKRLKTPLNEFTKRSFILTQKRLNDFFS
jgi:hypothetical protein